MGLPMGNTIGKSLDAYENNKNNGGFAALMLNLSKKKK